MRPLSIVFGFVLGAIVFVTTSVLIAWTGPTSAPPSGNVAAPLNVGTTDQIKDGGIGLNSLAVFGNAIINGASRYLNFGTVPGDTGYGFRDNAGVLEFKNETGGWSGFLGSTNVQSITFTDGSVLSSASSTAGSTLHGGITYAIPGTHTFTVPEGASSVKVIAVGAGGGGGGTQSSCCSCGGSGGSGAVAIGHANGLVPGETVAVQVGSAGTGGSTGNDGTAGTASFFGSYVVAGAGGGGGRGGPARDGGPGGIASGPGLYWNLNGLQGGRGGSGSGCSGGGGPQSKGPFSNVYGLAYGGAGNGASNSSGGFSGQQGFVFLEW